MAEPHGQDPTLLEAAYTAAEHAYEKTADYLAARAAKSLGGQALTTETAPPSAAEIPFSDASFEVSRFILQELEEGQYKGAHRSRGYAGPEDPADGPRYHHAFVEIPTDGDPPHLLVEANYLHLIDEDKRAGLPKIYVGATETFLNMLRAHGVAESTLNAWRPKHLQPKPMRPPSKRARMGDSTSTTP